MLTSCNIVILQSSPTNRKSTHSTSGWPTCTRHMHRRRRHWRHPRRRYRQPIRNWPRQTSSCWRTRRVREHKYIASIPTSSTHTHAHFESAPMPCAAIELHAIFVCMCRSPCVLMLYSCWRRSLSFPFCSDRVPEQGAERGQD